MIHIALTIDCRFVRFCAVTMASVMKNNAGREITFHIVEDGSLQAEDKAVLQQMTTGSCCKTEFYSISDEEIKDFVLTWESHRLSKVVFYRCLLASVLPASLSRVLYMDCDILVLGPLDDLWNTDLDGYALAAVPDDVIVNKERCERLHYDASYNYFNGGVLLLNLDFWRQNDVEEKCREYYKTYPQRIVYNDQDLLNGLLHRETKLLGMTWNLQEGAYRHKTIRFYTKDLLLHPMILHYSARKPWQYHCMHPLRHLFFDYQDLTRWKGCNPLNSRFNRLHRFFHLLPYTLRLKKNKYVNPNKME